MKEIREKYPWINFEIDLRKFPLKSWIFLGECVSKCEHIKQVPLLPHIREELHKVYLVKGIQATTAIEGNTLSEEQIREILEGQDTLENSKKYLKQEVENILQGCNDIAKTLQKGKHIQFTAEWLCKINAQVLKDAPCEDHVIPGQFRKVTVGVGRYRAPEAKDVQSITEEFCKWINNLPISSSGLPSLAIGILKAITAHLYIAWIHPFGDGNGRTARLVEFAILLESGAPSPAAHLLSNHYNATRMEYYRQLDGTSKSGGDIMSFFSYALEGFHEGLIQVINFIIGQVQYISWEHYIYERFGSLPSSPVYKRQRNVLREISRAGEEKLSKGKIEKITANIYMKEKKSVKSLTRDLNQLVKMNLLREEDELYSPNLSLILEHLPFSMT